LIFIGDYVTIRSWFDQNRFSTTEHFVQTLAQYQPTQTERLAFGSALPCAVAAMVEHAALMHAAAVTVITNAIKRRVAKVSPVSRFIGFGWHNGSGSIRGASPLVANG
jgi:hypothetical protein